MLSHEFIAHSLTSKRIRVLYDVPVDDAALSPLVYALADTAEGTTPAYLPSVVSVSLEDDGAYLVNLSESLTFAGIYGLTVSGVTGLDGIEVGGTSDFRANVPDPPKALGAFFSDIGCFDILFDRDVSLSAAPACVVNSTPATAVFVPWVPGASVNAVRFQIQPAFPTDTFFSVAYSDVSDVSLNSGSGSIPLSLNVIPQTTTYADAVAISTFVLGSFQWQNPNLGPYPVGVDGDNVYGVASFTVYFTCPVDAASASDPTNWNILQYFTHADQDPDSVSAPDAFDPASLIVLANDVKSVLNHHYSIAVHYTDSPTPQISSPDAFDSPSAETLVSEMQSSYLAHAVREPLHRASDPINIFSYSAVSGLSSAIAVANKLKTAFNGHVNSLLLLPIVDVGIVPAIDPSFGGLDASPYDGIMTSAVTLHVVCSSPNAIIASLNNVLASDSSGPSGPYGNQTIITPINFGVDPITSFIYMFKHLLYPAMPSSGPDGSIRIRTYDSPTAPSVAGPREFSAAISQLFESSSGIPSVVVPDYSQFVGSGDVRAAGPISVSTETSLLRCIAALNEMWALFELHRHETRTFPDGSSRDIHKATDASDAPVVGDVATAPLQTVYDSANSLLAKLRSHAVSTAYHVHADPQPVLGTSEAVDQQSLSRLVETLCAFFDAHTSNAGMHLGFGERMRCTGTGDVVVVSPEAVIDGEMYATRIIATRRTFDVRTGTTIQSPLFLTAGSQGVADIPRLSGVLPRIGIEEGEGGRLVTDKLELTFSKPMARSDLSSAIILTAASGPNPTVVRAAWSSPDSATVVVEGMREVYCFVDTVGLTDLAGNPAS